LSLAGTRVFVVEDEALVLLSLLDMLDAIGCSVAASAQCMGDALRMAAELSFDIALLDVSIAGNRVDPVADLLASRKIPFAFASGYEREALPERFRDRPLLAKPYVAAQLHATLAASLARVIPDRPHAA
jgi:CheY-like chemotaxis protein